MKKLIIAILYALIFCVAVQAKVSTKMTTLYPVEASATKYGQTIRIPDLSGLPLFSAIYQQSPKQVIVRRGDRKLTLSQTNNGSYYQSGQYGSLKYSMKAYVYNGIVSKLVYTETEDDITVKIIYTVK